MRANETSNLDTSTSDLIGIGIMLSGSASSFQSRIITPEEVIWNSIPRAMRERRILHLLHTWIINHHQLIHADILRKLVATSDDRFSKAILGGLLSYTNDSRFEKIMNLADRVSPEDNEANLSATHTIHASHGKASYDQYMQRFGVMMTELSKEDDKKFRPLEYMLEQNPFIACRMLFGSNWRADVAAVMAVKSITPYEIAKTLKCSYETAHRNHSSLKSAGWPRVSTYKYA